LVQETNGYLFIKTSPRKLKPVNFAGIIYFEPYPGWKKDAQNVIRHLHAKTKKEDAGARQFSFHRRH
jgi:hypothetical protein